MNGRERRKSPFGLLELPLGGILVAAGALAVGAWQWSRTRAPAGGVEPVSLDPELERRLDDELARFDA